MGVAHGKPERGSRWQWKTTSSMSKQAQERLNRQAQTHAAEVQGGAAEAEISATRGQEARRMPVQWRLREGKGGEKLGDDGTSEGSCEMEVEAVHDDRRHPSASGVVEGGVDGYGRRRGGGGIKMQRLWGGGACGRGRTSDVVKAGGMAASIPSASLPYVCPHVTSNPAKSLSQRKVAVGSQGPSEGGNSRPKNLKAFTKAFRRSSRQPSKRVASRRRRTARGNGIYDIHRLKRERGVLQEGTGETKWVADAWDDRLMRGLEVHLFAE
ncbi:hypothetical protein DFH09DRAFT_1083853 [Mycena vulgaris]|nr:hypothetical protein DFH09DRAFT_1083853 [Mycena vulgaris]